jgi:hypothetical protein
MGFTSSDTAALQAAILGGGGPCTLRETGTVIFSDTAGTQVYLIEGIYEITADATNAKISIQPSDGTAATTLGATWTLPRNGGSITGTDDGASVTLGAIEQWESAANTYKHVSVTISLPSPGSGLEWQLVVDPVDTVTGKATPIKFTYLKLSRPHAAILD